MVFRDHVATKEAEEKKYGNETNCLNLLTG